MHRRHSRPTRVTLWIAAKKRARSSDDDADQLASDFCAVAELETLAKHHTVDSDVRHRPWLGQHVGAFEMEPAALGVALVERGLRCGEFVGQCGSDFTRWP